MIETSLSKSGGRNGPVLETVRFSCTHPSTEDGAIPLLREEILRLVARQATESEVRSVFTPRRLIRTAQLAEADLFALASKDPAARGSWWYVWDAYSAYRATLAYRVAHAVEGAGDAIPDQSRRHEIARCISEAAKVETGAEIHPTARIGRRFVLDHGTGTVIGETTVIGDDAYVLQGVVLGARGIAKNPAGRRHPQLGKRVEVGAFARILGPVSIGDDVLIAPYTVVTTDIPSRQRVRVVNQYQGTTGCKVRIFGVVPVAAGVFDIHGSHLAGVRVELLMAGGKATAVGVLASGDRVIRCAAAERRDAEGLRLVHGCGAETVVYHLAQLWRELEHLSTT